MKPEASKQLEAALQATGIDLRNAGVDVAQFAAISASRLSLAASQPGFAEAVQAEADRVWLFAARRAVRVGDAADARAIGLIHGVLLGLAGA